MTALDGHRGSFEKMLDRKIDKKQNVKKITGEDQDGLSHSRNVRAGGTRGWGERLQKQRAPHHRELEPICGDVNERSSHHVFLIRCGCVREDRIGQEVECICARSIPFKAYPFVSF